MTDKITDPDELADIVYQEQGYLIISCWCAYKVGDIIRCNGFVGDTRVPLKVIGISFYAEFRRQWQRQYELSGQRYPCADAPGLKYYRTEPCD